MTSAMTKQGSTGLALAASNTPMISRTPFTDAMTPRSREEAWTWCQTVASENWVPSCFRRQPMLVAIAVSYGERFGMDPLSCLQNIAVINGKPCMYGDMMLAVCRKDPEFEGYSEEYHAKPIGCTVTVRRKGGEAIVETFDETKARRAGLWGKQGPWTTYPERMCMWRARGFALRTAFPDRLQGIISREEAMDFATVDHRGLPAEPVRGPVRDAEPISDAELSLNELDKAEALFNKAQTWPQFVEAQAGLKALALSGEDPAMQKMAELKLAAWGRILESQLGNVQNRTDLAGAKLAYDKAPEAVRSDLVAQYNAAVARAEKDEEDEKWQRENQEEQQAPMQEDDVPY